MLIGRRGATFRTLTFCTGSVVLALVGVPETFDQVVGYYVKSADTIDAFIGSRVRLRRMTLGLSQEQLGEALGLTFQQVQKYEKGLNRIGAGRLYRIAQALSAPIEFFFEGLPACASRDDAAAVIERNTEIQSFIASPDGHVLALSFQRIQDPATRRRVLDLVNSIAPETLPVSG